MEEAKNLHPELNIDFSGERQRVLSLHQIKESKSIPESVKEGEWIEIRLSGKLPERRSNHASFIYENLALGQRYLYIHGGRDLREGAIENMWRLDLDSVMRATEDQTYPVTWEQVNYRGVKSPGSISHHKCAVIGDKVVLIGGLKGEISNTDYWLFDLRSNTWEIAKIQGDAPESIDDHSLVQVDKNQLLVFGGFAGGSRVNTLRLIQLNPPNTLVWQVLRHTGKAPIERNAHAAVQTGQSVYVFGGQDADNNKLGDMWEYNLKTSQWTQINYQSASPQSEIIRSGHAAVTFGTKLYIFGGIFEVTKELNDLLVYDFSTSKMNVLDYNGDSAEQKEHMQKIEDSVQKNSMFHDGQNSPIHRGKTVSPQRKGISPTRKSVMMPGGSSPQGTSALGKSPTKKMGATISAAAATIGGGSTSDDKGLSSPTSVSMQNSFIIKNADESFDLYYQQMKRRRHQTNNFAGTQGMEASHSQGAGVGDSKTTSFQRARKPNARDGHSANVDKFGFMFVFGGDRHQMPFNDLYLIKLPK